MENLQEKLVDIVNSVIDYTDLNDVENVLFKFHLELATISLYTFGTDENLSEIETLLYNIQQDVVLDYISNISCRIGLSSLMEEFKEKCPVQFKEIIFEDSSLVTENLRDFVNSDISPKDNVMLNIVMLLKIYNNEFLEKITEKIEG